MKLSEDTGMATRFFTVSEQVRNEVKQRVELIIRHQIVHLYRGVHCFASLRLHTPTSTNKEIAMSKKKKRKNTIGVGSLTGDRKDLHMIIREDMRTKGRIYYQGPNYASLSHDEAIKIADRLVDLVEGAEISET